MTFDPIWSPPEDQALRERWDAGKTAPVIAAELTILLGRTVTSSAVVGRAHRIKCSARPSPLGRGRLTPEERARVIALGSQGKHPTAIALELGRALTSVVKVLKEDSGPPRAPTVAPPGGCVFPMWGFHDRPSHRYCVRTRTTRRVDGEDVASPYCAEHHRACYLGRPVPTTRPAS